MRNPLEQDYSEAAILAAYESGVIPYTMVIHVCDVCETLLGYPEFRKYSFDDFQVYRERGVIITNSKGNFVRVDRDEDTLCESCQTEMEALDRAEGIVLYPPKKPKPSNPFL